MRLSLDLGLGSVATLNAGVGWSAAQLDAYMAAQTDGLYYDFTKTDRHFQESIGPTLADDVGEAIGLALGQREWNGLTLAQVLAAQTELVTNGTFASGVSGWSAQGAGGVTFSGVGGALQVVRNGDINGWPGQIMSGLVVGKTYRARVRNAGVSPANMRLTGVANSNTQVNAGVTMDHYFVAVATTQIIGFWPNNDLTTILIDDVSVKLVPGNHAVQATGSLKGIRQTSGNKFDGSDDNNLTPYLAQNGANFIEALVTVPAVISATQIIAGASGASANRVFLALNTSGQLCAGVGSDSVTIHVGTTDLRSSTDIVVGVSFDGTTVKLFANGAEEYSGAQNSTPTTAIPWRIGANNNNGTAGSFFGGSIKKLVAGREALTLARYQQIRSGLLAA